MQKERRNILVVDLWDANLLEEISRYLGIARVYGKVRLIFRDNTLALLLSSFPGKKMWNDPKRILWNDYLRMS